MTMRGKNFLASLGDAEALSVVKPAVTLFNSPGSPIQSVPGQFSQPAEVQATFDAFKVVSDAASPADGKQVVNERNVQRQVFNEDMGNFLDFITLASRKDPSLPGKFGIPLLGQVKAKSASKTSQLLAVPFLQLQTIDKEPGTVRCRVRGGVKRGIEIHNAYSDPSNESSWSHLDSYVNGAFAMTGLSSGRRTFVRGRYIFPKGNKGPWSEMVSIMVP